MVVKSFKASGPVDICNICDKNWIKIKISSSEILSRHTENEQKVIITRMN